MVKLKDVAEACGTSIATVSYVLNGQGTARRISKEMQDLIFETAEELGYKRKPAAQKPKKPRIAIYWPKKGLETTLVSVLNGLNSAILFDSVPVSISICPYEANNLHLEEDLWSSRIYDAAIIVSASAGDLVALAKKKTKIPVVVHNRILDGYPCVTINQESAGRLAAEQAICKAKDNIGLVINPAPYLGLTQRGTAISKTCQEYGVDIHSKTYYCENNIDAGYELGIKMMRDKTVPKAIICTYDIVGFGLMRALIEGGFEIGKEVHIINTCTSLPQFFAKSTPPMTVVDMKMEEVTHRAVRLAIDLALQRLERSSVQPIIVEPQIIYRESSPVPSFEEMETLKKSRLRNPDTPDSGSAARTI